MPSRDKSVGRPRQEPRSGERVQLSFRITPELKRNLDSAAVENGRSQSQEAEIRLARSFEREDMLDQVFGKAVEAAIAILGAGQSGQQPWLRGSVKTKDTDHPPGDEITTDGGFVFILEGDADEAVERAANGNIPYANDTQSRAPSTLNEYRYLARKNRFRLCSSSKAAETAADVVHKLIRAGRKTPSRDLLAGEIRKELVAQLRHVAHRKQGDG